LPCGTGYGGKFRKVQERSKDDHRCLTYIFSGVALEGTGVDLDICAIKSTDCSALFELDVPPPGIGARRKSRNVL
jgi:hypothetical protein